MTFDFLLLTVSSRPIFKGVRLTCSNFRTYKCGKGTQYFTLKEPFRSLQTTFSNTFFDFSEKIRLFFFHLNCLADDSYEIFDSFSLQSKTKIFQNVVCSLVANTLWIKL